MYTICLTVKETGEILRHWSGRNWLRWDNDVKAKEYATLEEVNKEIEKRNKRLSRQKTQVVMKIGSETIDTITLEVGWLDVAATRIESKEW